MKNFVITLGTMERMRIYETCRKYGELSVISEYLGSYTYDTCEKASEEGELVDFIFETEEAYTKALMIL